MARAVVAVLLLTCAACGGDSGFGPTPTLHNISGAWTGTITSRTANDRTDIRIVFAQGTGTGNALLNGTWSMDGGSIGGSLASGLISNTGAVTATLSTGSICVVDLTLVVGASGITMSGDYSTRLCTPPDNGTVTLTKQ